MQAAGAWELPLWAWRGEDVDDGLSSTPSRSPPDMGTWGLVRRERNLEVEFARPWP